MRERSRNRRPRTGYSQLQVWLNYHGEDQIGVEGHERRVGSGSAGYKVRGTEFFWKPTPITSPKQGTMPCIADHDGQPP